MYAMKTTFNNINIYILHHIGIQYKPRTFQVSWVTKATYCNPFLPLSINRQTKTWFWQRVGLYQINEKCLPCLYDLVSFWMRFQEGGSLGKGISKLTSTKLSVSWPVGQWFWVLRDGKIDHIVNNRVWGGVSCAVSKY